MWWLISAALASTVAVLPLEQGAGGQAYDGLGKALAGMLVTDLAHAPGITLVERARLDALLAEIALAKTGFVDAESAQRVGRGLGAEFVVTGSYSVVGGQFLMDVRLVGVESGAVVRATDAQGPASSFVDVEKRLVAELLGGLAVTLAEDARQRILASVLTRDFDAFAAYGEGLARQDEGNLGEAQTAFGEALSADPAFREAATALGGLRQALDGMAAAKLRKDRKARADVLDKVVATFAEPKDGKDRRTVAEFGVRLLALQDQGRDCQRYAEMRAYLDRVGWKVTTPTGGYKALWTEMRIAGERIGLTPTDAESPSSNRDFEFRVQTDAAVLFASTGRYLYNFPDMLLSVPRSPDMLTTMTRCVSPPEQVTELASIAAAVAAHGVGSEIVWNYGVTLSERLEWSMDAVRARWMGVDDALRTRVEARIAAHEGDDETRAWLVGQARQIAAWGEQRERARVAMLGFREREIVAVIDALADGSLATAPPPACTAMATRLGAWGKAMQGKPPYPGVASMVAPFRDMGCVAGVAGRFADAAGAQVWVATSPARARPEYAAACQSAFAELPSHASGTMDDLTWYYGHLVMPLCVADDYFSSHAPR